MAKKKRVLVSLDVITEQQVRDIAAHRQMPVAGVCSILINAGLQSYHHEVRCNPPTDQNPAPCQPTPPGADPGSAPGSPS